MKAMRKFDVRISATFIGKEPSMGFWPGKEYVGWVRHNEFISDEGPRCPYSVSGFLTFWENVQVLDRNRVDTRIVKV